MKTLFFFLVSFIVYYTFTSFLEVIYLMLQMVYVVLYYEPDVCLDCEFVCGRNSLILNALSFLYKLTVTINILFRI